MNLNTLDHSRTNDFRKAVLEARNEATPDGVVVVDQKGRILLHNRKFGEIWGLPEEILRSKDDNAALQHALTVVANREEFINRVHYIYKHPEETTYDELHFRDGRIIERYGKAVIGEDDVYYGWAWLFRDITDRKQQELRQQKVLDSLPQMAWTASPAGKADYYNRRWYEYTGKTFDELKDAGWKEVIHPDDREVLVQQRNNSLAANVTFEAEARFKRVDGEYRWHVIHAVPISEKEEVLFWVGTCTDIHDQKLANQQLEENKNKFAHLANAMPQLVWMAEASGYVTYYNDRIQEFAGAKQLPDGNWQWEGILHPDDVQSTANAWQKAVASGTVYEKEHRVAMKDGSFRWHLSRGLPYRNAQGTIINWYGTATDIHELKQLEEELERRVRERTVALEEQRNLVDNILKYSPAGVTVYKSITNKSGETIDFQCILANDAAETFTGISNYDRYTKTVLESTPGLKESPLFQMAVTAVEDGKPFRTEYYNEQIKKWLELVVVKMFDGHLINVFRDITIIKETQLELEQAVSRHRAVFNTAQSGMFTFAPVYDRSGDIIDFRFVIANAAIAAYVGKTPDDLNGSLGSAWFPGYLSNGVFDMYKHTFLTGETLRQDIHYNVDQHDVYLDLKSIKVGDEVLVTFNDFTALKKAQLQLEKTVEELKRTNTNLEEFAYAASHDLKEPVRKIQVFTDRLRLTLEDKLNDEQRRFLERVEFAAKRMSSLIEDLLLYSYITAGATFENEVNLNEKVSLVLQDLDLEIEQKGAIITFDNLPTVNAHRRQMQQLFHNLLGNALKYSKAGVIPMVHISSTIVKGSETPVAMAPEQASQSYHLITVKDNGIGFRNEDADRIFNVFTRLDSNTEHRGSGIGLSIVHRIVSNHHGFIWAEGELGKGAAFYILLPADSAN